MIAVVLAGCGARTLLDDGTGETATLVDAGAPDAGRPDAGPPIPDAGPPAQPCARHADCVGLDRCRAPRGFSPVDLEPHPLVCGSEDRALGPGGSCRTGTDCSFGLCSLPGVCMAPCVTDGDCASGERCRQVWVKTSDDTMQPLQACTAFVAAPEGVTVEGPVPSVMTDMFDVAPDTVASPGPNSLSIWVPDPEDSIPFVAEIRTAGPAPVTVFDGTLPATGGPDWGIRAVTTTGDVAAIMYPNGINSPASPTGFVFDLASFRTAQLERLTVRRAGEGTTLDIDFYLVGGQSLRSPDGAVPRPIARGLDEARAILRAAGLNIGEVRIHEVVGELRRTLSVLEGRMSELEFPEELDELWRLSAGANRPAVHVFYVRMIDQALGIASGIPGSHVLPGMPSSGVAIAGDSIDTGMLGLVIGHEIGHYMGLFHTSERDGVTGEPHPDTPVCLIDRDENGDGLLAPSECLGFGADNLMFWAGGPGTISPQQAEVMRRAYFVR